MGDGLAYQPGSVHGGQLAAAPPRRWVARSPGRVLRHRRVGGGMMRPITMVKLLVEILSSRYDVLTL